MQKQHSAHEISSISLVARERVRGGGPGAVLKQRCDIVRNRPPPRPKLVRPSEAKRSPEHSPSTDRLTDALCKRTLRADVRSSRSSVQVDEMSRVNLLLPALPAGLSRSPFVSLSRRA